MQRILATVAAIVVAIGIGAALLFRDQEPQVDSVHPAAAAVPAKPTDQQQERISREAGDRPFELDFGRLYDRGYAADPGVRALADAYGIAPECLLALARYRIDQVPLDPGICPKPGDNVESAALRIPEDHPYHQYTEQELRSLAQMSPEAAVILARRLDSADEAREMYERAVALSGTSGPLLEWMADRNTGGLYHDYGRLNLDAAKVGYEIFLIAAALDGRQDPILETYEAELRKEGVDLAQIQARAVRKVQDLDALREQLTGIEEGATR